MVFLFVFVLDDTDCNICEQILEGLEFIDDDCDRHGITFVKTKDFSVAEQYGVHDFPALVYFENSVPNVFEGILNELVSLFVQFFYANLWFYLINLLLN